MKHAIYLALCLATIVTPAHGKCVMTDNAKYTIDVDKQGWNINGMDCKEVGYLKNGNLQMIWVSCPDIWPMLKLEFLNVDGEKDHVIAEEGTPYARTLYGKCND